MQAVQIRVALPARTVALINLRTITLSPQNSLPAHSTVSRARQQQCAPGTSRSLPVTLSTTQPLSRKMPPYLKTGGRNRAESWSSSFSTLLPLFRRMLRTECFVLRNVGRVAANFGRRCTPNVTRNLCSLSGRNPRYAACQYYVPTSFLPLDPFAMVVLLSLGYRLERSCSLQAHRQEAEHIAKRTGAAEGVTEDRRMELGR